MRGAVSAAVLRVLWLRERGRDGSESPHQASHDAATHDGPFDHGVPRGRRAHAAAGLRLLGGSARLLLRGERADRQRRDHSAPAPERVSAARRPARLRFAQPQRHRRCFFHSFLDRRSKKRSSRASASSPTSTPRSSGSLAPSARPR